jgi:ATP-dependent Clp protease adaptor protein ClpS
LDYTKITMRLDPHALHFNSVETETQEAVALETDLGEEWHIVLYNDDDNTFDHVINMLVKHCGHDPLQAEQCAVIVHFKGKCQVKSGSYALLEPICTKLLEAQLNAEIEP